MRHWRQRFADDCVRVGLALPHASGLFPLAELYCCTECCKIVSEKDAQNEIDFYYCSQCIEALTLSEAGEYGYNCYRCFLCPVCTHVLTYVSFRSPGTEEPKGKHKKSESLLRGQMRRSNSRLLEAADESSSSKVCYRLDCGYCNYSTSNLPQIDSTSVENLMLSIAAAKKESQAELFVLDVIKYVRQTPEDGREAAAVERPPPASGEPQWRQCEETLARKEFERRHLSVWDEWKLVASAEAMPDGGAVIPAAAFLDLSRPQTARTVERLFQSINAAEVALAATAAQRTAAFTASHSTDVTKLLPLAKPLLAKASKRCSECKRFMTRNAMNPLQPPRLNGGAPNIVPRCYLLGVAERDLQTFLSSALQRSVQQRFPRLRPGDLFTLLFEISNAAEVGATVKLQFNPRDQPAIQRRPADTVQAKVSEVELRLEGFNEYAEHPELENLVPYKDADGRFESEVEKHGVAVQQLTTRALVAVKCAVGDKIPSRSLLQISLAMTVTGTNFQTPLLCFPVSASRKPPPPQVMVLGRSA